MTTQETPFEPAKKSLGQHFLTNPNIAAHIAEAAAVSSRDTVVEIGPGRGILTRALLPVARDVIAIEKDERLLFRLSFDFKKEIAEKKLILVGDDALNFNPQQYHLQPRGYKLVANIPYYITGAIIRKFLGEPTYPNTMTLMVQKEVADRIVAKNNKESLLSIAIKVYGNPRYIHTVKAGSFSPPPSVDSAIISIQNISHEYFKTVDPSIFFTIVRAGFAQKRKQLISNLSRIVDRDRVRVALQLAALPENIRAEDVSLENWKIIISQLIPHFKKENALQPETSYIL